jgi:hypothetical protein
MASYQKDEFEHIGTVRRKFVMVSEVDVGVDGCLDG